MNNAFFRFMQLLLVFCVIGHISIAQNISTYAGHACVGPGVGYNLPATDACIGYPTCGSFDSFGNYYFAEDFSAARVLKVDSNGFLSLVAGNGLSGFSGDGGPATNASIYYPSAIADVAGNIFIADRDNHRVRKVDKSTGIINTIAGNGLGGHIGDNIPATNASIFPLWVCVDHIGNIYFLDSTTWIRKISTAGIITTIAGNGIEGYSGDGGPATAALVNNSGGALITDSVGNIYVGTVEGRIRKINISTGVISTIAGNGVRSPYLGDGLAATNSQFIPAALAMDKIGNIYIADYGVGNSRILKIDTFSIVYSIAGTGIDGYSGDGGPATAAQIANPEGVAVDACGNVYIADDAYKRIRKVTYVSSCHPGSLSVLQPKDERGFSLNPNPAYNEITIQTGQEKEGEIIISNMLGEIVYSGNYQANNISINIKHLPHGMYLVRVNRKWVQRFVKE